MWALMRCFWTRSFWYVKSAEHELLALGSGKVLDVPSKVCSSEALSSKFSSHGLLVSGRLGHKTYRNRFCTASFNVDPMFNLRKENMKNGLCLKPQCESRLGVQLYPALRRCTLHGFAFRKACPPGSKPFSWTNNTQSRRRQSWEMPPEMRHKGRA